MMEQVQPSLIMRNDTILGVCQAIGDDFGFSPMFLRVPFAVLLLLNPIAVVGAYFGLGALVLVSRLAFPDRRRAGAAPLAAAGEAPAEAEPMAIAA